MCSGINDNCNIYWSDWFIDCKHKIYSNTHLNININFKVLSENNYGHTLSIHLLYQVHIIEMFIVKSDVTVTKFLYLCICIRVKAQRRVSLKQENILIDIMLCLTLLIMLPTLLLLYSFARTCNVIGKLKINIISIG